MQEQSKSTSNRNGSAALNGLGSNGRSQDMTSESDRPERSMNGAAVNGSNGYQGVDAQNNLEGSNWRESSSMDEESVRSSKDLVAKDERSFEGVKEEEARQAVK